MSTHSFPEGFTAVARLLKPYALRGEVKAQCLSFDFFRYKSLSTVRIWNPENGELKLATIDKATHRKDFWYLHIEGVDSPEAAGELRKCEILVLDEERPELPEGQYYFSDLKGLKAVDFQNQELGAVLLEATEGASCDLLHFQYLGKKFSAPWIGDCVGDIDMENGTIQLNLSFLKDIYDFLPEQNEIKG
jgi:16S rRNA processing protein RimM